MDRQIVFRGRVATSGKFVYGSLIRTVQGGSMIHSISGYGFGVKYLVDSDTVGQFTGLCDRNGRKIYEGDIVRISMGKKRLRSEAEWIDNYEEWVVTFKDGAFNVADYSFCTNLLEVVGTKYDSHK